MASCSLCGRYYIWRTGRRIVRAMVAQGQNVQTEFPIGICGECRAYGDTDSNLVYVGDDDLFKGLTIDD